MTDHRDEDVLRPPPTLRDLDHKLDSVIKLVERYTVVGGKTNHAVAWVQAIGVCCQGLGTLAIAAVALWLTLHLRAEPDKPIANHHAVFTAARTACE